MNPTKFNNGSYHFVRRVAASEELNVAQTMYRDIVLAAARIMSLSSRRDFILVSVSFPAARSEEGEKGKKEKKKQEEIFRESSH